MWTERRKNIKKETYKNYAVSNDPNSCGRRLTDLKRAVFTLKDNNNNNNKIRMTLNRPYHFPFGTLSRPRLRGIVEGDLTSEATAVDLSNQLDSIVSDCRDASNISVTYYTTELPYETGPIHNLDELVRLFRDFRSQTIANEKEIPIEVFSVVVFMCKFSDGSAFLCNTQLHS